MSGTLVRSGESAVAPERLLAAVLGTLTADKAKQAYGAALAEFFAWNAGRGEPLSKALLEIWRGSLLARGLSVSSVNQRLSAVRALFARRPRTERSLPTKRCVWPRWPT